MTLPLKMGNPRVAAAIFLIALSFLFLARVSSAQTLWTDATGDWFNPANWSIGVPNSSTGAEINNNGTAQIALTGAATASLYLGFGPVDSGNLLVSGSGTLTSSFLVVGNSGTGTVTVQSGGTVSNPGANIGNEPGSNGAVLVEGPGSSWTTDYPGGFPPPIFNVGYSGAATLTIRNGGTVSSRFGGAGTNSGSSGVVLIDGVGSLWTTSSVGVSIGGRGTGNLTIQNGGAAKVGSIGGYFGRGVVLVDGTGSTMTSSDRLIVGNSSGGSGSLTIQNGADVSDVEGYIGWYVGSTGAVLIDGAGSTWTNTNSLELLVGSLTIQNEGAVFSGRGTLAGSVVVDGLGSILSATQILDLRGILTVQNGGAVSSNASSIRGGTVLIDGVGSDWNGNGQLDVGSTNNGSVTIRNGGTLSSRGLASIGSNGGSGVVLVEGVGSFWNNDNVSHNAVLHVGLSNVGTLNIFQGGGVFSVTAGVGVGPNSTGHVSVDGAGSELRIGTNLYVGGGDLGAGGAPGGTALLQIVNDGKISATTTTVFGRGTIIDNALLVSQNVSLTPGGLLSGGGIVSGDVTNAGQINPGDPIGSLTIDGNYTQLSNGKLIVEVGGAESDASDHLNVTGSATIDGTLEVRCAHGFLPISGQVIRILTVVGTFSGSFAQINFPDLRAGFQFQAEFVNGVYQITALNDGVAATGFLNISTRMRVGTGDNALIGGFIVTGNPSAISSGPSGASKKVIMRAIGPSLAPLSGRIDDPTLELRDSAGGLILSNDNWMESLQAQEIIDSGIPPSDQREAAIVAMLAPGSYTATMRGANNTTGIGVVEVYDLAQEVSAKLANISTRGFVETDDNVMIGGFIAGNQATHVIVRALGPSLTQSGVSNALADPTLELHNAQGAVIAFNNDWQDTDQVAIEATGIPPTDEKESAVFATLSPGNYTAIVRGLNDTTGVSLVEVYHLQ